MPQIATQQFGVLDYEPGAEIQFPLGLPGFDQERAFILIERPATAPVLFLQSVTTPGLCFATLPVACVDRGYELQLHPDECALLTVEPSPPTDLLPLAILAAAENGRLTANLLAPVVINLARRVAVQAVRADTKYSYCHALGEAVVCS